MTNELNSISRWRLFKWGARNHPGTGVYAIVVIACYLFAFKNDNVASGLMAATVVTVFLGMMFVVTSISVGNANRDLVEKEASDE